METKPSEAYRAGRAGATRRARDAVALRSRTRHGDAASDCPHTGGEVVVIACKIPCLWHTIRRYPNGVIHCNGNLAVL